MDHELTSRGAGDFVDAARVLLATRGSRSDAAAMAETLGTSQRVRAIFQKAAVDAATLGDPAFAGGLADYRVIAAGFLDSMRALSVFDRLMGDGALRRAPLKAALNLVTVGAQGHAVGEGQSKPISRLTLSGSTLEPTKAVCIVVTSQEIAMLASGAAMALLSRELRSGVAAATDQVFLGGLLLEAPTAASAGATAADVLADLGTLLELVSPLGSARLYVVTDPRTAQHLATMPGADGRPAFPSMGPLGGELVNLPVLVTDQLEHDSDGGRMMLLDAASIVADSNIVTLDAAEAATLQLDDDPQDGGAMTSLWQKNLRAVRAERIFGFEALRANAVAVITDTNYGFAS